MGKKCSVLGAWHLHHAPCLAPQQLTAPSLPVLGADMHLEVAAPYRVPDRGDQRSSGVAGSRALCSAGSSLSDNTPLIRLVRALCASSSWSSAASLCGKDQDMGAAGLVRPYKATPCKYYQEFAWFRIVSTPPYNQVHKNSAVI